MRRGCMIGCFGLLGLCVLAGLAGWLVLLPRTQDALGEGVEDALSTEVANQLQPAPGVAPDPGLYTITEAELRRSLVAEAEDSTVDDVLISIDPTGIELGFSSGGQDLTYSGDVVAENGRLVVTDFEANNDVMEFFFPADELAEAIEDSVNNYLAANGLRLDDVELGEGEMTLDVARMQG